MKILDWSHRPCRTVRSSSFLSWYHDVLGVGLWSSMDSCLFLFHLDMSVASIVYGYQVLVVLLQYFPQSSFRKLKPYRMLWWVAATAVHIILILGILASYTTFSTSYLHIDDAKLVKPVVFLSVILAILTLFEVSSSTD